MFKKAVIVGVGLIGGSLGLALKRKYKDIHITGVSSSETIADAIEMGVVDEGWGYQELGKAVDGADIVFFCTPINRILGLLTLAAPFLGKGTLVTDVGSTKREITAHAMEVLPKEVYFIGGHPMTGSERRGVLAADPFLFQNAIYVLCPAPGVPDNIFSSLSSLVAGIGSNVVTMDAGLHDRIAAHVSHLPQIISIALVELIGDLNTKDLPYLSLAAGGFRDMTRIASSPFVMWDDIFKTNSDDVREAIDAFIERLKQLKERLETSGLGDDFEAANVTRASIPRDSKGFLSTLHEVLVVVEDKPGVIANIAVELAKESINIKDIEVLKVREGEGGTLRLAFEFEQEAERAIDIFTHLGYTARLRR